MTALLLVLAAFSAGVSVMLLRQLRGGAASRIAPWVGGLHRDAPVVEAPELETLDTPETGPRRAAINEALAFADMSIDADQLIRYTVLGTLIGAIVFGIVVGAIAGIAMLFGVPLAVRAHVRSRVKRRRRQFADQLADTVQMIASAMRAGHGLSAAIAIVADDTPEPMAAELHRIVAAAQIGMPLDEAFAEAAERTGSRDLGNVGMVAALQRDLGGNGAETLDRIVETIRGRDDLRRLVTTLTAQGRISHRILTALPLFSFGRAAA